MEIHKKCKKKKKKSTVPIETPKKPEHHVVERTKVTKTAKYNKINYYKRKKTLHRKSEELCNDFDGSVLTITISPEGKLNGYMGGIFGDLFETQTGKDLIKYCKNRIESKKEDENTPPSL